MVQNSNFWSRRILLGVGTVFCLTGVSAQVLDQSIDVETRITRDAAQAQQQINRVDDETQQLIDQYRRTISETQSLATYNDQLQAIVSSQENEIASINQQLEGLEATNRDVVPLMIDMATRIGRLVDADMPFRLEERQERARRLVDILDDADITTSEKYRLIIEAYQTEIEYGRTTEAYEGELDDGKRVQFLRIGRTLLFWQSSDGSETGWWNPIKREFETLDPQYRLPVSDGLAIARNQVAPDLIRLPVPAPIPAED